MKVITKVVIDLNGVVVEEQSYEYAGPIAECKDSGGKQVQSQSSKIIGQLSPQIKQGIMSQILDPTNNENLTKRTIDLTTQASNAGYAARGLAGSGIAQRGATRAATDAALAGSQQQQQALIGLLGAGSGAPSFSPQSQPRGMFGLK